LRREITSVTHTTEETQCGQNQKEECVSLHVVLPQPTHARANHIITYMYMCVCVYYFITLNSMVTSKFNEQAKMKNNKIF